MTKFKNAVINVVARVPKGNVVSYGQVALYVGAARAARQVGWILNGLTDVSIPWWRVINNTGRISIKGSQYSAQEQKALLIKEGIEIKDDLTLDMEKYRFHPDESFIKRLGLDPLNLSKLLEKLSLSKPHFK